MPNNFVADSKMNKCTAEDWRSQDDYDYEDYCGRKNSKHHSKDNCEEFTVLTSRKKSEGEKHLLVVVKIVRVKPKRVQFKAKRRRRRRRLKKKPQLFLKVGKIKKVKPGREASCDVLQPFSALKRIASDKMTMKYKISVTQIQQLVMQMSTESEKYEASTQETNEDNLKVSWKVNQQKQQLQHLDHRWDQWWDVEEEDRGQELFLKSEIFEMEQSSEISCRRRRKKIRKKNKRNKKIKGKPKSCRSENKPESGE